MNQAKKSHRRLKSTSPKKNRNRFIITNSKKKKVFWLSKTRKNYIANYSPILII